MSLTFKQTFLSLFKTFNYAHAYIGIASIWNGLKCISLTLYGLCTTSAVGSIFLFQCG